MRKSLKSKPVYARIMKYLAKDGRELTTNEIAIGIGLNSIVVQIYMLQFVLEYVSSNAKNDNSERSSKGMPSFNPSKFSLLLLPEKVKTE